ncbi:MocR-like pyridoxine biosynthesis transcription factor PdxR [Marinobacterium jannaschii]|uniref:MocR-like pyridoxine biosynthesis transcription factor PdxR n=1 Tax=Marinobacterium jannaschii TaxID=64970 RepID=UPI000486A12F|nr:PLP-dependent aminotransferase family protein [Marinobacterium jannaschii]
MSQQSPLLFAIDRTSKTPIFEQICESIRRQAHSGRLKPGITVPATRTLAGELSVSRSTVVTAYEQLVAEGYLQGRRGAGYTLCAIGSVELPASKITAVPMESVPQLELKPLAPSEPDMRLFPYRQWAKAVARVCRTEPEAMLLCDETFGNLALRQAIAEHVREWRDIEASAEQIIVTAGASDALNICLRTLIATDQSVGIEDPGYQPITQLLKSQGIRPVWLDVDQDGARLPCSENQPTAVVITPSHQYPLGGVMSPQRRAAYINWANHQQGWIIEDDYDSEFRYGGRPIPALAGFDALHRTLYIGSFAKIFSNRLRLGYLIVPKSLIDPMRQTMDNFGLRAGLMPQQALAEFMRSGDFYRHLRRVRKRYNERRRFLVEQLKAGFSQFGTVQDYPAGMQLVFHLNNDLDDREVAQRAQQLGIGVETLSDSTARALHYNGLVLGFSGYSPEEMRESLSNLQQLLSR